MRSTTPSQQATLTKGESQACRYCQSPETKPTSFEQAKTHLAHATPQVPNHGHGRSQRCSTAQACHPQRRSHPFPNSCCDTGCCLTPETQPPEPASAGRSDPSRSNRTCTDLQTVRQGGHSCDSVKVLLALAHDARHLLPEAVLVLPPLLCCVHVGRRLVIG